MPFKKGQSGNPNGRKVKTAGEREVEALAREHGPEAIKRLKFWMKSKDSKASIPACQTMLNRGYGMPKQAIIGGGKADPPIALELIEIRGVVPK